MWLQNIVQEMLDEDFLPGGISAEHYAANHSPWDSDSHALYLNKIRMHWRCSDNQTRLSNWRWLIGDAKSTLPPLMCVTKRSDNCELVALHFNEENVFAIKLLAVILHCLFALAGLISLAVWLRQRSSTGQGSDQVGMQLFLLRALSGMGLAFSTASVMDICWGYISSVRLSVAVLPAAILVYMMNINYGIHFICLNTSLVFNLLIGIFLVEWSHPAQTVLLFVNLKRVKVALLIGILIGILVASPYLNFFGYLYCTKNGVNYLLAVAYPRYSVEFVTFHVLFFLMFCFTFMVLAVIMLIVFASKLCCACCRGPPTEQSVAEQPRVSYARLKNSTVDKDDEDDDACDNAAAVTIVIAPTVPGGSHLLANELKKILVGRLVFILLIIFGIIITFILLLANRLHVNASVLYHSIMILAQPLLLSSHTILATILSPTFRNGLVSIVRELLQYCARPAHH